jgi:hypothetical protein
LRALPSSHDSVDAKTVLMISKMKAIKPMTFTKLQMIFD